ncbi:GT4 family glycosyltransferase PelF [Streptococcus oricebi]|uniref:Glycosyl transferase n=1 Tax=Streptococcus oricebi TaxID=1547447 RepID=A0ABS5B497_9STRE|nr:GT4 family glycosyltransferase PelF [Streptococcus oricebi]MBP2623650.1 glycosyl transferase [Streptococcus oricebi]
MKICLVLEGSYPYVHGGVSTWAHQYITEMKEHEFVIWAIGAKKKKQGEFVYDLPSNVIDVHEVFLDDLSAPEKTANAQKPITEVEYEALYQLVSGGRPEWAIIFQLFQTGKLTPDSFLESEEFFAIIKRMCSERYALTPLADVFHTMRSMLFPLLCLLCKQAPEADVYHAISTGYGGVLATLGSYVHQKPLLLTEHGIYTREREEELIRSDWVLPSMKQQWIEFFYVLSDAIYSRADRITSLFTKAREIQIDIGCEPYKCQVISNGIDFDGFSKIPLKKADGWVDIGAIIRMAPIKDVKTLIYAFYEVSSRLPKVRLHIMGGIDDQEYADECFSLAKKLQLDNLIFTGRVDIKAYMEKLDFTILTSISEGQPLSVLESMAAGRPCVTTDVGCCKELLEGRADDELGLAGYCVPPTYRKGLAEAMIDMCQQDQIRTQMGVVAKERVKLNYQYPQMIQQYRQLYKEYDPQWQV